MRHLQNINNIIIYLFIHYTFAYSKHVLFKKYFVDVALRENKMLP